MGKEKIILEVITKEIEQKYNCKVLSIRFVEILSMCVMFKVQFNEDFIYKTDFIQRYGTPSTICFSEKSMSFTYRVDLFDCMKDYAWSN